MAQPTLTALAVEGDALVITWSDGARHKLRWKTLREHCPCATCRAKREQPTTQSLPGQLPILRPEETLPLKAVKMEPLGNYAYAIHFSDGHRTGIYSIEFLRRLGETAGESNVLR